MAVSQGGACRLRVTLTLGYVVERLRRSVLSRVRVMSQTTIVFCIYLVDRRSALSYAVFEVMFLRSDISMITYVSAARITAKRFHTIAQGRGRAAHPG